MARLSIWWDGAADGATNMAADEVLAAEAIERGMPLVRLSGWLSPTVSLGAFQGVAEARALSAAAAARPALVRRPSGGGAIVHGTDITYAIAIPGGHPWSREAAPLYRAVHGPLVTVLESFGLHARVHDKAGDDGSADSAAFFCFSRRSPGDVVVDRSATVHGGPQGPASDAHPNARVNAKVLGGAQRRLAGAVLQHGSLLLRANRDVPEAWRHDGLEELGLPVADMAQGLVEAWMNRLATTLGLETTWERGSFAAAPLRRSAIDDAVARYSASRWLERR